MNSRAAGLVEAAFGLAGMGWQVYDCVLGAIDILYQYAHRIAVENYQ
jgi:hypothetical protein